jgi:hypothetical protein
MARSTTALAAILLGILPVPALAGPPYDTDDPQPTDYRHWELYLFGAGARGGSTFDGSAGLDVNYGATRDLQLTATLPLNFARGAGAHTGIGDVELGVKYRFYHDDAGGFSIAAFPRLILPSSGKRYGSGKTATLLPLWAQKDVGKWSLFGGGGYAINPGAGNRNYWQAAGAVTRELSSRLSVGGEVTHRGPDSVGARPTTTLGLGAIYRLKGPLSLLTSAGPSFAGHRGDRYHVYVALGLTY